MNCYREMWIELYEELEDASLCEFVNVDVRKVLNLVVEKMDSIYVAYEPGKIFFHENDG